MSVPSWPVDVAPVTVEELARLGIGPGNALYWDGRRVEVHSRLTLSWAQKTVAIVVSICAILGGLGGFASGLGDASAFLCARGVHWLSCPVSGVAPGEPSGRGSPGSGEQ